MFGFKKMNYLKRTDLINSVDSNKVWSKSITIPEAKLLLDHLEAEISKHDFDKDQNFMMNSRRKSLKSMIEERLQKSDGNPDELVCDSLFNFFEYIGDEYPGSYITNSRELGISKEEFDKVDKEYRDKGIICVEEKDTILEMIKLIKDYINGRL